MRTVSVLLALLFSPLAQANVASELSPAQLAEIQAGRQVVVLQEMPGHPWPRIRIFQMARATPEEVAAVFFDYTNAKDYIPKLLKSNVSKTLSPCVIEVDYGVDVPILPDEFYTARNSLTESGGTYRIDWTLVRALQTKASEGHLRIERFGKDALLCYTNLVTPGSKMAGILRIPAIDQMKNTVAAIVRQVESQRNSKPADLQRQVALLRAALTAERGE
ncbi:MAG: hypothetical protein SFU53_06180 [Terrimicrobiaceae bacterium]|nr:hypothetical protein [Terrimicrobiaceae bacterium]